MRNKQKGFSLIELLIVVAIILIIAAIAIPNLLRSKMAANEASAVGSLRTINTASVAFSTTYGNYPTQLPIWPRRSSASSTSADLIDTVLASGTKSGYTFAYGSATPYQQYSLTASPTQSRDRPALLLHRPVRCDPRQHCRSCNFHQHANQLNGPNHSNRGEEASRFLPFFLVRGQAAVEVAGIREGAR